MAALDHPGLHEPRRQAGSCTSTACTPELRRHTFHRVVAPRRNARCNGPTASRRCHCLRTRLRPQPPAKLLFAAVPGSRWPAAARWPPTDTTGGATRNAFATPTRSPYQVEDDSRAGADERRPAVTQGLDRLEQVNTRPVADEVPRENLQVGRAHGNDTRVVAEQPDERSACHCTEPCRQA